MDIRKYLSFVRLGHKAVETDSQVKKDLGMHLLYDGTRKEKGQSLEQAREDSQPCLEPVDIIAVHGLGGGALSTWRHPESNTIWLQTLLPVTMPISRIMSYGYDATISASQNSLHVMDIAENLLIEIQRQRSSETLQSRRVIFIGHSMGGIIIKKALIIASIYGEYQSLLRLTNGVMFMGTPHNGAKAADLAYKIINIANLVTTLNKQQLKMLKTGSESLRDISRAFGQLSELRIVTVFESNKTYIPWTQKYILIVPQDSARLNLGDRETVFSIAGADHHGICKFREDDMQYSKIEFGIKTLATAPTYCAYWWVTRT
ncbi:hypothetical protein JMJ35_003905 [Cladonia borealis]|uniref:GPI inositol-deacylase n=1 Tax=Cladonia borealis TaxID=184061 RepID=A0AA39R3S5_9LECA|nr:hypothetical protein JMJ35_003905 [Cladonia borealis]